MCTEVVARKLPSSYAMYSANLNTNRAFFSDVTDEPVLPLVHRREPIPEEPSLSTWTKDRMSFDDVYFASLAEEEERIEAEWKRRRPRRIAVRVVGLAALAGIIWTAVLVVGVGPARRAIVEWGTLGSDTAAAAVR
jgi:hypothetical protein